MRSEVTRRCRPRGLTVCIEDWGARCARHAPLARPFDERSGHVVSLENTVLSTLVSLGDAHVGAESPTILDLAAVVMPHVSNHDDVDPLRREEGVRIRWVDRAVDLGSPNPIIIPGT